MGKFYDTSLAFSSLGLLGAVIIIFIFAILPKHRRHPAEIILAIAVCDFFLALRFFIRAVAWQANPSDYDRVHSMHIFDDHCAISVIWAAFFENASLAWNACWCLNFTLQLKYPTLDTRTYVRYYHVYAWCIGLLFVIMWLATDTYGGTRYHEYIYCGQTQPGFTNGVSITDFFFALSQAAVAFVSLRYAYQRLQLLHGRNTRLLKLHAAYVIIFALVWLNQRVVAMIHGNDKVHQGASLIWQAQAFYIAMVRLAEPGLLPALLLKLGCSESFLSRCFNKRALLSADDNYDDDDDDTLRGGLSLYSDDATVDSLAYAPYEPYTDNEEVGNRARTAPMGIAGGGGSRGRQGLRPYAQDDRFAMWGVSDSLRVELEVADTLGISASTAFSQAGPSTSGYGPPRARTSSDAVSMYGDI